MYPLGTDIDTTTAGNALIGKTHHLVCGRNALGIGAPFTSQRAAFEKNERPYTGTIMHGVFLNVKYDTLGLCLFTHDASS
jgi:hypothetical protein